MKEENEYKNQLDEMKSQLYQIKILLLILITLCILGFYGISRSMWDDIAGKVTGVCEFFLVAAFFIAPVMFFIWTTALVSLSKTKPTTEEGSRNISAKTGYEKEKPASQQ
jgi:hypothetical protein